jgi:type IV pilus assembly protein PilW
MMKGMNYKLTIHRMRPMHARMIGLTLVEMLIAVVLSLGLIGGIVTLYVNVGESASYLNAASRIQENGRFALDYVVRTMRMAGYDDPEISATTRPTLVLEGKLGTEVTNTGDNFIKKVSTELVPAHAVVIRHEGAGPVGAELVRDCLGSPVAEDSWVENTYLIAAHKDRPLEFGLVCITDKVSEPQFIAEGIEGMEVLYGFDSDADADGVANRYYEAASVPDWARVVSAKIALLVNSVGDVYSNTLHDCESCEKFNPTTTTLMRAEFQATINFRNPLGA